MSPSRNASRRTAPWAKTAGALGSLALAGAVAAIAIAAARRRRPARAARAGDRAARQLHAASALLAASVLLDSSVEHYRGSFENPGMYAPLLTSAAALANGISGASARPADPVLGRTGAAAAMAIGGAGTFFHVYNIIKRPGGLSWLNLFYAAPPGAPAALALSGLVSLVAQELAPVAGHPGGIGRARAIAALASVGIAGTVAEVALLHYRGAFQNPFMFVPLTLPPLASAVLARAAVSGSSAAATRPILIATAVAGVAGVAFHAYGVSRAMGGWRNWSQNVLDGPPLPAPPAFTAFSLVGLTALSLLEGEPA